jgi:hypothetical protein
VPVYSQATSTIAVVNLSGLGKVKVSVVVGQCSCMSSSRPSFTNIRGLSYHGNVVAVVALNFCHIELVIVCALVLDLWVICHWSAEIALVCSSFSNQYVIYVAVNENLVFIEWLHVLVGKTNKLNCIQKV